MSKRKIFAMDFFSRQSQPSADSSSLISFYEDASTDSRGRTLTDILGWGVKTLESSHDYIQILFPLPEQSGVNDRAPTINRQVFEAFRARPELRDRLGDAFKKMLWFYGFELHNGEDGDLSVKKGDNYQTHCENWLTRFDHNHLRITRIIRCLRVLGLEEEALAFYETISLATVVSARSRMYWERAAYRPLNIRPDVDDDEIDDIDRFGPQYLRDFETKRRTEQAEADTATEPDGEESKEDESVETESVVKGNEHENVNEVTKAESAINEDVVKDKQEVRSGQAGQIVLTASPNEDDSNAVLAKD